MRAGAAMGLFMRAPGWGAFWGSGTWLSWANYGISRQVASEDGGECFGVDVGGGFVQDDDFVPPSPEVLDIPEEKTLLDSSETYPDEDLSDMVSLLDEDLDLPQEIDLIDEDF